MIKNKQTRRTIAIFFLLNFLSTIMPYNALYAQTAGPNAPEAGAFEPVDATDMVNLLTGNFTYVLPLMNVPSPEGGYPIALSYHAGIGMDQEASWVGLGWNLNPGAINRNVNGVADDSYYSASSEYFYSNTETIKEYQASLGYSGYGFSVATGVSWGSNRSLGGFVSVGVGVDLGSYKLGVNGSVGTDGFGLGAGLSTPSGLSFGISTHSKYGLSGSLGFDKNGSGFSISTSGTFDVSLGKESVNESNGTANITSVGISFSSAGVGISVSRTEFEKKKGEDGKMSYQRTGSSGVGMNSITTFDNTVSMGDYSTSLRSSVIPITIPTPIGIFSFSFGKTTFKYWLNKFEESNLTGPIHFNNIGGYLVKVRSDEKIVLNCNYCSPEGGYLWTAVGRLPFTYTQAELDLLVQGKVYELVRLPERTSLDINELAVKYQDLGYEKDIFSANPNFPNYDKYNVQAQGLSGAITPTVFENGALYGFNDKIGSNNTKLSYAINDANNVPSRFRFNKKVEFNFENEISTYLAIPKPTLDLSVFGGASSNTSTTGVSKRRTSNFVKYYTNNEIAHDLDRLKSEGFIKPVGYNRPVYTTTTSVEIQAYFDKVYGLMPKEGIGAFKVTAIDGKTYHYGIPVYNHDIIQRTYGTMKYQDGRTGIKPESEAYFEKKQLQPFATHWLLTAVTGPDFIDVNNNGIADKEDYGYWVNFEYGKYTDAYIWSAPYGKDVITSEKDSNTKTWIKGRKEIYYLDKISTRTHSAYFVKSEREDAKSRAFIYKGSIGEYDNAGGYSGMYYGENFTIPEQKILKLDKIILIKNEKFDLDNFTTSSWAFSKYSGGKKEKEIEYLKPANMWYGGTVKHANLTYDALSSVVDKGDNLSVLNDRIVKVVEFDNNHYDLVKGTPNSDANGRLTLKGVTFKGKNETSVLPPYRFNYITPYYNFNIEDKDDFGYYKNDNSIWSLNEIITPQGGKIKVEYEGHKIKPVIGESIKKSVRVVELIDKNNVKIKTLDSFSLSLNEEVSVSTVAKCYSAGYETYTVRPLSVECNQVLKGRVKAKLSEEEYVIEITNGEICETIMSSSFPTYCGGGVSVSINSTQSATEEGGIRVKRISTVSEEGRYYNMNYTYGDNGDGIGYVTYLPSNDKLNEEVPYSSELPPPIPMYEYVSTTTSTGNSSTENNIYGVKTDYRFNILKSKEPGIAKFGDFYELTSIQTYGTSNSNTQFHDFVVKDNLGAIGQLLSVKSYNQEGQILSNIQNTYYNPEETPNKLGVTQESFQTYKKVTYSNNNTKQIGVTSTRITYPNLLKHSTELKRGNSYTSEFNDLDPITGQAREIYSYSSTGQKFLKRSEQAYTKYPQMGSKVDNITNKNMLSQVAASYSYLYKNEDWKPIGVGITTWSNNWVYKFNDNSIESSSSRTNVWRKHKKYVWKGAMNEDGTLNYSEGDFNWTQGASQSNNWEETSHITRYNQFSKPLEAKDINGNYAATKMGDDYSKIIATANANYDEMYYSGAEYRDQVKVTGSYISSYEDGPYFDGGVKATGHKIVPEEQAHTGVGIVEVNQGANAFEVTIPANTERNTAIKERFKVSVWCKNGQENNLQINVGTSTVSFNEDERVIAGDWVLNQGYIKIPSTATTVSIESTNGAVQLDDFRLHPAVSSMMSYVYNEWDEVSYITGANGLSTHYIYDAAGRLIETQVETVTNVAAGIEGGFKKVSENNYNYKRNNQ